MTIDTNTPADRASAGARPVEGSDTVEHEEVLLEKPMLTARIIVVRQVKN